MERTGHRSIEAVRSYKRSSHEQLEQVSDILNKGKADKLVICFWSTLSSEIDQATGLFIFNFFKIEFQHQFHCSL